MTDGSMRPIGDSEERLYGPYKLLVAGLAPEHRRELLPGLEPAGFKELPVVFVGDEDGDTSLGELLTRPHRVGEEQPSSLAPVVVMSGFTERELHRMMAVYRILELPRPLWATLTPVSEGWTIRSLVQELARERAAMEERRG